ncbi:MULTISPECIES: gas vesicle protein GvpO [Streptomyces]|uniref:Gas vesicle protein n=1 Tax=Streptomyces griseiscabiei TaxID=2993540 RepID=A0ABU4LJ28_9ACTN|nr:MULTISPECIES: gas vesicle protein [Streptomyces]MBZ3904961.1 gas vesicle protein [Streptomyces griseiscabiei]MDX2915466.1 gas vesicle protein [Streptomyces griseiscabiei]
MSNTSNTSRTPKTQNARTSQNQDETEAARKATDDRPSPVQVLRHARDQLEELTGMAPESVSSFEQTEGGWTLEVEVLEIARVPDTMSLLASYRVELDAEGGLTGYRRVRRYERGRADPHRR